MASKQRSSRKASRDRRAVGLESLRNAVTRESTMNYEAIFDGFAEMGIPMEDVKPRENVFTYNAFLALGRQVRKGEHGVKVVTYVEAKGRRKEGVEPDAGGEAEGYRFPRTTTVFHISQTDPIEAKPQQLQEEQQASDGATAAA